MAASSTSWAGSTFGGERSLRDLLIEAIRATDTPEVRARMNQVVDTALDRTALQALLAERALGADALDTTKVESVRDEMEKASASRLQPHFITQLLPRGFARLGGKAREREPGRYELTHVPGVIRQRARDMGLRPALVPEYERIAFDKATHQPAGPGARRVRLPRAPAPRRDDRPASWSATATCSGGAPSSSTPPTPAPSRGSSSCSSTPSPTPGRSRDGRPRITSRRMAFVELRPTAARPPPAPRPTSTTPPRPTRRSPRRRRPRGALADRRASRTARSRYAIADLAREHLDEVRKRTEERVAKTVAAVQSRLTHEIDYWDRRADEAAAKERAGKSPGELNSTRWRQRANDLSERLERRLAELELERRVTSLAPVVVGGALVIPAGLLVARRASASRPSTRADPAARTRVEQLAMDAVMAAERAMGHEPQDVSGDNLGYDILSRTPDGLRFVEVKGRAEGATTVTVTRNEIQTCLNEPEKYWLAVVDVRDDAAGVPSYLVAPFRDQVPFAATSVNFSIRDLLDQRTGDGG